jgi:hypothetical protein
MAPKIDPGSNALLVQRYDDMYNGSAEFKARLHNIVTANRVLKLLLDPGIGDADYDLTTHSIRVWRKNDGGGDKTDTELRNDLFFELHNAKRAMAFAALDGPSGYNIASLGEDIKKRASYALATEWEEWINVAESTIRVYIVNQQAGTALLTSPPEYRDFFDPGDDSWLKFSNYVKLQVGGGHTVSYDKAATGPKWKGFRVLELATAKDGVAVAITANEITPGIGQQARINTRGNPFAWDLVKGFQLA